MHPGLFSILSQIKLKLFNHNKIRKVLVEQLIWRFEESRFEFSIFFEKKWESVVGRVFFLLPPSRHCTCVWRYLEFSNSHFVKLSTQATRPTRNRSWNYHYCWIAWCNVWCQNKAWVTLNWLDLIRPTSNKWVITIMYCHICSAASPKKVKTTLLCSTCGNKIQCSFVKQITSSYRS